MSSDPDALHVHPAPPPIGISPKAIRIEGEIATSGVMICTPAYGGMVTMEYAAGISDFVDVCQTGFDVRVPHAILLTKNESLVQRARNQLVGHFMASTCSHLVFVDADISFTGMSVLRLIASGHDIVGGVYRKKDLRKRDWALNFLPPEDRPADLSTLYDQRTGCIEVAHLATGFLCIHRRVIQHLYDAHPEWHYRIPAHEGMQGPWRDHLAAIFDCAIDPVSGTYLSEDWLFCNRARAAGFRVMVDPGIVLHHCGNAEFAADPMEDFYPQISEAMASAGAVEFAAAAD